MLLSLCSPSWVLLPFSSYFSLPFDPNSNRVTKQVFVTLIATFSFWRKYRAWYFPKQLWMWARVEYFSPSPPLLSILLNCQQVQVFEMKTVKSTHWPTQCIPSRQHDSFLPLNLPCVGGKRRRGQKLWKKNETQNNGFLKYGFPLLSSENPSSV